MADVLEVSMSWFEGGKGKNDYIENCADAMKGGIIDFNCVYDYCRRRALQKRIGDPEKRDFATKISLYIKRDKQEVF